MKRRVFLWSIGSLGAVGAACALGMRSISRMGFRPSFFLPSRPVPEPKSPGFLHNQLGYLPESSKQATLRLPPSGFAAANGGAATAAPEFHVRSTATNEIAFTGKLTTPASDAPSGDLASIADFSALQKPGTYRLESAAGGTNLLGDTFVIGADVYAAALKSTMRGYYGQRCGCAVDLGGGYAHPACHTAGDFHATSGKSGSLANHGGWHDAGDYGRYIVNSGITTGTLLWAWELYPKALATLKLDIPASQNSLPDHLAEIRWNLEWMLSLQDSDGGVWHKQTSEQFCAMVMPQDDTRISYVIGIGSDPWKSTAATADLAAVAAIAARCYAQVDSTFAQRCLAAARLAWEWATTHPNVPFQNPSGIGTGGYDDAQLSDELAWASAELWRTTGEEQYEAAFLASLTADLEVKAPGWDNVLPLALWTYALADRPGDPATKQRIREATHAAAVGLIDRSAANGYGNTLSSSDYVWGSNAIAGNQSLLLLIADRLQPNKTAKDAAMNNLHYLLGRNCFGVSWVTGLGLRPFQHPHHRPSVADGIAAPWPGLLSGGPNAHGGDAVADRIPTQPPMRMWADDDMAYSMNEIAINWNAPLVFILAAAQG